MVTLQQQFGNIDIYLFDQILRGRIAPGMKILDAGCGDGRNLVYLLREGYAVFGVDCDPEAIAYVRRLAGHLTPAALPAANFQTARLENIPHPDASFDAVVCNAVLHFAEDDGQFHAMLRGMWRVLKPGGVLFCRLASSIGMEKRVKRIAGRRYLLPDESERYLVDEAFLENLTNELQAELLDPIKTTIVQNQRCMTTWVLMKR
jgi:ubiquinone/menaquinone biosynthesis C-methylase UbiE